MVSTHGVPANQNLHVGVKTRPVGGVGGNVEFGEGEEDPVVWLVNVEETVLEGLCAGP